jgi:hypothetical protein
MNIKTYIGKDRGMYIGVMIGYIKDYAGFQGFEFKNG